MRRRVLLVLIPSIVLPLAGLIDRGVWVSGQCEPLFSMQMYSQVGGPQC